MAAIPVALADVPAIMARLAAAGVSGRQSGLAYARTDDASGILTVPDAFAALAQDPGPGRRAVLSAQAAAARYARETAGVSVDGIPVATDRGSQAAIDRAARGDMAADIAFKGASGTFVTLPAARIAAIDRAVRVYVQACFTAEAALAAAIAAGTVTTPAQVEAWPWPTSALASS